MTTVLAKTNERELLEIQLLLEGVYRLYGYDFREYTLSSLRRRLWEVIKAEGLTTISGLQEKLLHDRSAWDRFLQALTLKTIGMFDEPALYLTIRDRVLPLFDELHFVRIWIAGCSTGEEVYSTAILLHEQGLYERCRIYATDISDGALRKAREGIYNLTEVRDYEANYPAAGGRFSFRDYYTARYDRAILRSWLKDNILFSPHNLVTDSSFNEFNLILCRNVMAYFNQALQDRVHRLLYDSLANGGILGLGARESLKYTPYEADFETLGNGARLYVKVS